MLEVPGENQAEPVQIVHDEFETMVNAFHRAFDDFSVTLFEFHMEGMEIVDPDIRIDTQPAASRLVGRRQDAIVRFAKVNYRYVSSDHGVNRGIEKIAENLETWDIAAHVNRCYRPRYAATRISGTTNSGEMAVRRNAGFRGVTPARGAWWG